MNTLLLKDVMQTVGSIYGFNAKTAIGYLFNTNKKGTEISYGMYCHSVSEINKEKWTFFLDFSTKQFLKL